MVLKRCLSVSTSIQFSAEELLSYHCALACVSRKQVGGTREEEQGYYGHKCAVVVT